MAKCPTITNNTTVSHMVASYRTCYVALYCLALYSFSLYSTVLPRTVLFCIHLLQLIDFTPKLNQTGKGISEFVVTDS